MRPERRRDGRVAVVLVNWNGAADTLATLASLDRCAAEEAAPATLAMRPIVVDNGSSDGSPARLRCERPGLEVIESGGNLGFAGGNAVGIRSALADPEVAWVLLLNTDVEVDPGFLQPLLDACADPAVGAAGPKIFYFDPPDRLWAAGGRLRIRETVTEEFGRGQPDGPRFNRPADVTYLTTCCLLIPRDALERVGPLDPAYFINVDDADWCRRALDAGYRLRYVPESRVWHKVAAASGGAYSPGKTFHTARSNAVYVRRHAGPAGLAGFLAANLVALPVAWLRELPRGNAGAVAAKARGLLRGLREPLPEPPRGLAGRSSAPARKERGRRTMGATTLLFTVVVQLLLLLLSISAHEAAHAWVADRCGDSTARLLGRVSLNPLRHLDPFGSVLLPLLLAGLPWVSAALQVPVFGWGRPPLVLVKNLRRPYWNALAVATSGPAVNLALASLATVGVGFAAAALGADARKAALAVLLYQVDDGTARLAGFPVMFTLVRLATINAFLAAFNLLPLPPLDGGQIALQTLPADWAARLAGLRPYGLIIGMALAMLWVVPVLVIPFHLVLLLVINYS